MTITRIIATIAVLLSATASLAAGPLATVGSRSISKAEVEEQVRPQLIEIEQNRFEILEAGLDGIIDAELVKLEAAAQKITVAELMKQEVDEKAQVPPAELVTQIYEANKEQLGQPFEDVKEQLESYVAQAGIEARRGEFLDSLRTKYDVVVNLQPPTIAVANGDRPYRGGADAPITIVAFSDYECPFCKRGEEALEQVLTEYGDKVKVYHRDFPLSFHANAHKAAQAAHCANDQGKFWDYHSKLFSASDLTEDGLAAVAKETGLDEKKFSECLAGGKHAAAVDQDMKEASAVGVNGTPAFFINGRSLSGAQPFEAFKEIIDAELARAARAG